MDEVNPPTPNRNVIQFDPEWPLLSDADAKSLTPVKSRTNDAPFPVVIGEDDPVSRRLIAAIVEKAGYHAIVTDDGAEIMAALRAHAGPCVAVIDWMMPGMDGPEVCRRIREADKQVYIIMVTARAAIDDAVKGLEGGADDYLVKPFDRRELLARIGSGMRILTAQLTLTERVRELELAALPEPARKFQMPL